MTEHPDSNSGSHSENHGEQRPMGGTVAPGDANVTVAAARPLDARPSYEELLARVEHLERRAQQLLTLERDEHQPGGAAGAYEALHRLDFAGAIVIGLGHDERVTEANGAGCRLLGYSEDELVGSNWFDTVIPATQREPLRAAFHELLSGNLHVFERFENPVVTKRGEERLIAWHNTIVIDARGRATATLSVGEDITERRRIEDSLRLNEERLRLAAEVTGLGLWDWSPLSDAAWWDQRSRELFWMPPDVPVRGSTLFERMDPSDREPVGEAIKRALDPQNGGRYTVVFRLHGPQGELRWIEGNGRVFYEGGRAARIIGTALDITARKEEEERLVRLYDETRDADRRQDRVLGRAVTRAAQSPRSDSQQPGVARARSPGQRARAARPGGHPPSGRPPDATHR